MPHTDLASMLPLGVSRGVRWAGAQLGRGRDGHYQSNSAPGDHSGTKCSVTALNVPVLP